MIEVKVTAKKQEAIDICSYELSHVDGALLPAFSAGSHIDVHVPGGLTRQYSLCNDAAERHRYRIAVLRDAASRGGSVAMHDQLKVGDLLQISEPRNHFALANSEKALLFAGGIGVTPLLCMAQRLQVIGADFSMHYCARSKDRTAFQDEIVGSALAGNVQFHYDDGPLSQRLDLASVIATPASGTHLYICGPAGFIEWISKAASDNGWPSHQVHQEYFGAAPQDCSGNLPFQVKIASSGQVIDVPADQSVTGALRDHGIEVLVSCEQGVCGTCITRVLEGECDHHDFYFTDEEKALNDQFTPCCSRAKPKMLVLDL